MKKHCTKCGELKVLKAFPPNRHNKDGHQSHCRLCTNKAVNTWYKVHPNYRKEWNKENSSQHVAANKRWREANPEQYVALVKRWYKENPGKASMYKQARVAAKLQAMPPWLTKADKKKISKLYEKAVKLGLTVDHEIPLRGKGVCGLHVPWNLQLMTSSANSAKGNKYSQDV